MNLSNIPKHTASTLHNWMNSSHLIHIQLPESQSQTGPRGCLSLGKCTMIIFMNQMKLRDFPEFSSQEEVQRLEFKSPVSQLKETSTKTTKQAGIILYKWTNKTFEVYHPIKE